MLPMVGKSAPERDRGLKMSEAKRKASKKKEHREEYKKVEVIRECNET